MLRARHPSVGPAAASPRSGAPHLARHPVAPSASGGGIAALAAAAWVALAGCDRPCDPFLKRIQACAQESGNGDLYAPESVRQALRARCRRAVAVRVKTCLRESTCAAFMRCASRALRAPPSRL